MQQRLLGLPALLALVFSTLTFAFRPVQFVKHNGESGKADQAFSLVNYYNATTDQSDLYVRMWSFRYKSLKYGWTSLGLGPMMKGSLMFVTYGDPAFTGPGSLTFAVRTVDGHHPPRPIPEMKGFYDGYVPDVTIVRQEFQNYTGNFFHEKLQLKPTHIGVAEFIVHGYDKWTAADIPITNSSTKQEFIWGSNFQQDFDGDYSVDRHIDMHQFGLGFGFIWVDLENNVSPYPFFGPIDDLVPLKGADEVVEPPAPTTEELAEGERILAQQAALLAGTGSSDNGDTSTPGADNGNNVEAPVKSPKQWNIRSLMWHLHGILAIIAFVVCYPLGVYFKLTPRPTSFNLHWTVNSLGTIAMCISAIIGFMNSRSISVAHQYLGFLLVCGLATQTLLGWRHHERYLQIKRKTWMSLVHVWLGRVILPVGMLNIVLGLLLRHYGWLTISLTIALMAVEVILISLLAGRARKAKQMQPTPRVEVTDAEAEEYFQLAGDDDFSDEEEDVAQDAARTQRANQKREEQHRLAKLDRV